MKAPYVAGFVLLLCILLIGQQNSWQLTLNTARNSLVQIEYYESIDSPESVDARGKIKRTLNGVVVSRDGLILTSPAIFTARLDISRSSMFGRSTPPSEITVHFQNDSSYKARFVGKDDDNNVAFVRIEEKGGWNDVSFVMDSLSIGSSVLLASLLDETYNNQLMLKNARINAVIEGPPQRLLSDAGGAGPVFALAFNKAGLPVGVLHNPRGRSDMFIPQLGRTGPSFTEIIPYSRLRPFIQNPPRLNSEDDAVPTSNGKKWLGINMQPFTRDLATYFSAQQTHGILINTVIENSPAAKAGLQIGDVIVRFNGKALSSEKSADLDIFRNLVRNTTSAKAKIVYWRDGRLDSLWVKLGDTPISQALADEYSNKTLGFSAKRLTKDIILAKKLDFDTRGVWISRVERAGPAAISGLRIGDLLLSVDDEDITTPDDVENILKDTENNRTYVRLFIKRDNDTRFLFINREN